MLCIFILIRFGKDNRISHRIEMHSEDRNEVDNYEINILVLVYATDGFSV